MSTDAPWLTVIVPCYNAEAYVESALRSVLDQGDDTVEVIAVNDGSTDRSGEIIDSFAPRVVAIHQDNSGGSVARNTGLQRATGQWILFFDADDVLLDGAFETIRAVLAATPDARFIAGVAANFSQDRVPAAPSRAPRTSRVYADLFSAGIHVFPSAAFFHRDVITAVGGWSPIRTSCQDVDTWLRIGDAGPLVHVVEPAIAARRIHSGAMTANTAKAFAGGKYILAQEKAGRYAGGVQRRAARQRLLVMYLTAICLRLANANQLRQFFSLYFSTLPVALRARKFRFVLAAPIFALCAPLRGTLLRAGHRRAQRRIRRAAGASDGTPQD